MSAPAMFAKLGLEQARQAAKGKWLFIDFTASWCGPCQHMDATTWVDPAVVGWMSEHAVAVQIDVDEDPAAKAFDVKAMPTVVAMRGDAEVDRIIGARNPKQLLEWIQGLEQGKTDLDRVRASVGEDPRQRFQLAQTLFMRGAIDGAVEQLQWLWEHALEHDPAFVGVRHSYVVGLMKQCADASARARAQLVALRDQAARGSHDWRSLNEALRDTEKTLAWFDELKGANKPVPEEHDVVTLLRASQRWKDVGQLTSKPLDNLAMAFQHKDELDGPNAATVPKEVLPMLRQQMRLMVHAEAANLVRAMKAAGRDEEARAVAAEARRRDSSSDMDAALREVE